MIADTNTCSDWHKYVLGLREDRQRLPECVRKARDRGCSDAAHFEGDSSTRQPRRGAARRAVPRALERPAVAGTEGHACERAVSDHPPAPRALSDLPACAACLGAVEGVEAEAGAVGGVEDGTTVASRDDAHGPLAVVDRDVDAVGAGEGVAQERRERLGGRQAGLDHSVAARL